MLCSSLLNFFSISIFPKNSSRNAIRVSNSLDPNQAQHFVHIRVQTVCKPYQQTTLVGNELTLFFLDTGTVKPVLSSHSKRRSKIIFKTNYRLMQVIYIAECSKGSILQYFRPSLSLHLSLRSLFCLFLNGHLRQVLL